MADSAEDPSFVKKWLKAKLTDVSINQDVLKAISSHHAAGNQQERDLVNSLIRLAEER